MRRVVLFLTLETHSISFLCINTVEAESIFLDISLQLFRSIYVVNIHIHLFESTMFYMLCILSFFIVVNCTYVVWVNGK